MNNYVSRFTGSQIDNVVSKVQEIGNNTIATTEYVDNKPNLIEITWAELKSLRDNSQLIPGRFYRITDYTCTATQKNTSSAGHVFDIIVRADSVNKLNEEASAIQHESHDSPIDISFNDDNVILRFDDDGGQIDLEADTWVSSEGAEAHVEVTKACEDVWRAGMFIETHIPMIKHRKYLLEFDVFNKNNLDFEFIVQPRQWADISERVLFLGTPSGHVSCTLDNPVTNGTMWILLQLGNTVNEVAISNLTITDISDHYFDACNLSAWELKYCLDNDKDRFKWANTTNGKGVIYRMIDEFGNNCPYDFKNILFTKSGKYTDAYTFSYTENNITNEIKDASLVGLSKGCHNNIMKEYNIYDKQELNFNVFYSNSALFGCHSNIFGYQCCHNTFNSVCSTNIFGNSCTDNAFGSGCTGNIFGNSCFNNTFGNICSRNTFGNHCKYNIFGNNYNHNAFGNYCGYNLFGNDVSSVIDYCSCNIIDDGCSYLHIVGNGTASFLNCLQYVHIHSGVEGTDWNRKTITVDRNLPYETNIVAAGTTTIEV